MLFKKLVRGNLGLWWNGNLPQNLRRLWRKKHGRISDPVFLSVLRHLALAIVATCMLFSLSVLAIALVSSIVDHEVRIATAFSFLVALMLFGFGMGFTFSSHGFYCHLIDAHGYLGLSFQDIATLSRDGLRHHAQKCLENSGKGLRAAEMRFGSYNPETEKLRTEFENCYATFRDLGVIEDVGYGPFIPITLST